MDTGQIPRIDRYTCKFENSVMEDQFLTEEWSKIKKGIELWTYSSLISIVARFF